MTIFLYVLLIAVGFYTFLIGTLSLRVSKRKCKLSSTVTYGKSVNKHLLQTGISVEHGMVITKSGKLQAQSKISGAQLDSMLLK